MKGKFFIYGLLRRSEKMDLRVKPCKKLGYGILVEYFPLDGIEASWNGIQLDWIEPREDAEPCPVFGHDCPVFYVAEKIFERLKEKT